MSVQVQKCIELVVFMAVHNDLLHSVDCRLSLDSGIYIASIQVYPLRIYSIVPSSHPVRIENGKNVKNEVISKPPHFFIVLSQLFEDSCHYV